MQEEEKSMRLPSQIQADAKMKIIWKEEKNTRSEE
jgi:hypothetical protein